MKQVLAFISAAALLVQSLNVVAQSKEFEIFNKEEKPIIIYDSIDYQSVAIVSGLLAKDFELLTGDLPKVTRSSPKAKVKHAIIIGSLDKSNWIKNLIKSGKITTSKIEGRWETYIIKTVNNPYPNIENAIVICGSDMRGTSYGVFDLSERLGVSPWNWWADVIPQKREIITIGNIDYTSKSPSVKYRGIFLNDEDWGLQPWAAKTFEPETGDIGPKTYAKIFELLLRLKANMIWPAMHPSTKAFYYYPENKFVAKSYGIVVGTSHAEPMFRNNVDEWDHHQRGDFNYFTNKQNVLKYWEERVKEVRKYDGIYTIGMRGISDSEIVGASDMQDRVAVMEEIIEDQRGLLAKYIDSNVTNVPQVMIPYKEVLEIYDNGLQVPEDVMIAWPDDNHGYIRRVSNGEEQTRTGGAGVYYHASYWGSPHDYLWLSSTHPALIREEMVKAYMFDARNIWVLNVGDIKPLEYNMELFLDMAYDIDKFKESSYSKKHLRIWASEQFGEIFSNEIASIIWEYYVLAFQRRPEFMGWSAVEPQTEISSSAYNHFDHNDEAQKRLDRYIALQKKTSELELKIPSELQDAFFQLVKYPVFGATFMNQKILSLEKAYLYAKQGRASANDFAAMSKQAYDSIIRLTDYYNKEMAKGKWNHMMVMNPRSLAVFDELLIPQWDIPDNEGYDVAPEGYEVLIADFWGNNEGSIPDFPRGTKTKHFIDIFLTGQQSILWEAFSKDAWVKIDKHKGILTNNFGHKQHRIWVSIDWNKAPSKGCTSSILFKTNNKSAIVFLSILGDHQPAKGFKEENGYLSIYAENFTSKTDGNASWEMIEGLGYTGTSMMSALHINIDLNDSEAIVKNPSLFYDFYTTSSGEIVLNIHCIPTHPVTNKHRLRFAVVLDKKEPEIIDISTHGRSKCWKENVIRNNAIATVKSTIDTPGKHTLKIYAIDPGVLIDRMTIDFGGLKKAYGVIDETIR